MIKDIFQKQKAIRYCVAAGMLPYPEVVVRYVADVAETALDISDIDVLGIMPAGMHEEKLVIFDCKTQAKISAINRALWAAGFMKFVRADEAFVILNKAAPQGHRLAANSLGVRLFSEKMFDTYGVSTSKNYVPGASYLEETGAWQELLKIKDRSQGLVPLLMYLLNEAPLEKSAAEGFRALLVRLKQAAGEFDVSKNTHRSLYGLAITQALVFLSAITREFHTVVDPSMSKEEFTIAFRYFIWGGKDGYSLRERLHKTLHENRGTEEATEFSLPGWDKLVELMRAFLDAPSFVASAALPLKDIAFRELCAANALADHRISGELQANSRGRQFALAANRYIYSLSQLLQGCGEHYQEVLSSSSGKV